MTTKKLIKELMGLNISRNTARRVVRVARKNGIANEDVFCMVCVQFYDCRKPPVHSQGRTAGRGGLFQLYGMAADGGICQPIFSESKLYLRCRPHRDAVVDRAGRAKEVRNGDRGG